MKNFILRILFLIFGVVATTIAYAKDYGVYQSNCDIRYFVTSGVVRTHVNNLPTAKVKRTMNAGDYVYVDTDSLYYNGGEAWVKISGLDEYVLSHLLTIEDNPYYKPQNSGNILESKASIFKFGFYNLPKWLAVTILCVWILISLILCLTLSNFRLDLRWCPPKKNPVEIYSPDPEYGYGQSKVLFFSRAPYRLFLTIAGYFLLAFVITIILFIIIGALVWLFTWIGRILLVGLFWIIFIGLIVGGIGLVLNALFGDEGRFWSLILCWIPIYLAIKVGAWREDVSDYGFMMTEWGTAIFTTFNIFDLAIYIVKTYWLTALLISVTPLLLFVGAAALFMVFAGGLMLYESIKMKRYNVTHPCPFCGEHSEPAVYLSDGIPLHVPLRPSVWGLYNIKHPVTGEKMPTLFLNGKDRLERRCAHCDGLISANIGAEKHIAVAGVPNSGKSTLLYRIISELCRMQVGNEHICRFTDSMGEDETSAKAFLESIKDGQEMNYFPEKTAEGRHKSIQLLAQNPHGTLPYRLYVNDIAGEMFTSTNNQYEDAPFFKNTNVLIFALDPFTMKANELEFSSKFASWYKKNVGDKNDLDGKVDLDEAFTALVNTINKYKKGSDFSKIKLMITYVKTDTGYLNRVSDKNDSALLREFAISDMGLESLITKLELNGFDISYHAISASDNVSKSNISTYISDILDNLGISFKNLSAKQLADRIEKMKQLDAQVKLRKIERKNYTPKDPNVDHTKKGSIIIILSFLIGLLLIFGVAKINVYIQQGNYRQAVALIKKVSLKPMNYDEVLSIIKFTVAEKSLNETHKKELTDKYMSVNREKRKHISRLRSILYANFESKNGGMSNFEVSLKYNALDLKKFEKYFQEFKALAPNDVQYLKYRDLYDKLLIKYNVSL